MIPYGAQSYCGIRDHISCPKDYIKNHSLYIHRLGGLYYLEGYQDKGEIQ